MPSAAPITIARVSPAPVRHSDAAPLLTGPKDAADADLLLDYYFDNGLRDPKVQAKWCAAS